MYWSILSSTQSQHIMTNSWLNPSDPFDEHTECHFIMIKRKNEHLLVMVSELCTHVPKEGITLQTENILYKGIVREQSQSSLYNTSGTLIQMKRRRGDNDAPHHLVQHCLFTESRLEQY